MVPIFAMIKPKPDRVICCHCEQSCSSEKEVSFRGETYGIRGHGHGEQVDNLAPPVRLEHVLGEKTVVDGCDVVVSTLLCCCM